MEPHFTSLSAFGDPVDPAYLRFKTGVETQKHDAADVYRWRWEPVRGSWYTYSAAEWSLDPGGLGTTQTPATAGWDDGKKYYKYWDFALPGTFRSLHDDYLKMAKAHPSAVWFFGTGQWFKPTYIGSRLPHPGPSSEVGVPAEAKARIARVRAFEAAGAITHDWAQHLINEIVAEYT